VIIRQATENGTVVFVIEGIGSDHSLGRRPVRNLFKRCELTIQLRKRLLQHLAVARVAGRLQLFGEPLPGKKQALVFPVALLLLGRDRVADGFAPL